MYKASILIHQPRLWLLAVALIASPALSGQCSPTLSDSAFADAFWRPGQHSNTVVYSSVPVVPTQMQGADIGIGRVVGPGVPAEFDASGFLANWQQYVNNGVLPRTAWIEVGPFSPPDDIVTPNQFSSFQRPIDVYLNGNKVATLPPPQYADSATRCVEISTKFMKFAQRGTQTTQPNCNPANALCAINRVSFTMRRDPFASPDTVGFMGVGTVTFKAMSPVILITGCCEEGSDFWNNSALPDTFKARFDQLKIPYDDRSSTARGGRISGSIWQGAGTLNVQIPAAAKRFGAQWVHLVAHSKGGLNARALLARNWLEVSSVGVLSLITLDTPHEGSIGADLAEQARRRDAQLVGLAAELSVVVWSRNHEDALSRTTYDLTQFAVGQFNVTHPSLPRQTRVGQVARPLSGYALSSDANRDNSLLPRISSSEVTPFLNIPQVFNDIYELMGFYTALEVTPGACFPADCVRPLSLLSSFRLNDFIVTADSQGFTSNPGAFPPLITFPAVGLCGNNHNSVAVGWVADKASVVIKSITLDQSPPFQGCP